MSFTSELPLLPAWGPPPERQSPRPVSVTRLGAAALLLAALAAALRIPALDVRPMHADEAILADKFGTLLERRTFRYDPQDFHGPVLEYLTLVPAAMRGQWKYTSLDEWTLRLVPALAGVALALSPLLLVGLIGETAGIASALLLATSPPAVFYSRYYIPETLLALFTALFIILLLRRQWVWAGLAAGLAIATKETAVIAVAVALPVFLFARWPGWWPLLRFVVALCVVPVLAIGPAQLMEAVPAYLARSGGADWHVHSWNYYLELLARGAPLLALPALFAWRRNARLSVYAFVLIGIYSAIPYKTPWCILSIVWALALTAGLTFDTMFVRNKRVALAALALVCGVSGWQAWEASVSHAADPENIWTYAQTGPDVYKIRDSVARFATDRNTRITVYTTQNLWPLPWYFRDYSHVGWAREVAVAGAAAPIVLVTPELEPMLTRKLYEGPPPGERELYVPLFEAEVALRPGLEVLGYVAKSMYDRAAETSR